MFITDRQTNRTYLPDNNFHEKLRFGTLMAAIGGFLDVYTYILHKGVFANAQTGNIVLIGVSIINADITDTLKFVYPVFAFIFGVIVSETIKSSKKNTRSIDWSILVLLIEVVVLFIIGLLPKTVPDICITTAISFISSVQISSFKRIRNSSYNTTMMTGNLRACTETLYRFIKTHDKELRDKSLNYFTIILFFITGAGLGSIVIQYLGTRSIWICCMLQIFLIIQLKNDKKKKLTTAST